MASSTLRAQRSQCLYTVSKLVPAALSSSSGAVSRMDALQISCNWCSDCSCSRSSKPQCSAPNCSLRALHSTVGKAWCCAKSCSKSDSNLRSKLSKWLPSSRSRSSTARSKLAGPPPETSQACSSCDVRISSPLNPRLDLVSTRWWALAWRGSLAALSSASRAHSGCQIGYAKVEVCHRLVTLGTARVMSCLQQVLCCCQRAVS